LTVLYDMLKDRALSGATKRAIAADFDTVLSLNLVREVPKKEEPAAPVIDPADMWIVEKIEERAAAKKAKNYALADAIRAELLEKGITLVDTKQGTTFKKA
ncbi:MAG: cysteine--tRNA ligase, partial [Clostridia bacterium]|nr:cysteine--tRNA ligase [Clostridia bacterium]